ncbi:MAG: sulfite exporter TauE/SafE family protein [Polyangiaceae bacterium]|nr:sulfite exporter TauE/SafE family protein [Polyangiaceae bacterium]
MVALILPALLAILVGVALGLLGGGGSILTVPILVYAAKLPAHEAIATSLFVVGTTSVAALVPHARAGRVRYETGAIFGAASMVGAFASGKAAHYIPAGVLLVAFAVMMAVTAAAMMRNARREPREPDGAERRTLWKILVEGLVVGAVTGLVGAGGGFLVVPALVLLGGLPMRDAIGTSLLVIAMKSFAGFAGYLTSVTIDWTIASVVAGAAVVGSFAGAGLVKRIPQATLRRGFAWFVVAMALFILVQEAPKLLGIGAPEVAHDAASR